MKSDFVAARNNFLRSRRRRAKRSSLPRGIKTEKDRPRRTKMEIEAVAVVPQRDGIRLPYFFDQRMFRFKKRLAGIREEAVAKMRNLHGVASQRNTDSGEVLQFFNTCVSPVNRCADSTPCRWPSRRRHGEAGWHACNALYAP